MTPRVRLAAVAVAMLVLQGCLPKWPPTRDQRITGTVTPSDTSELGALQALVAATREAVPRDATPLSPRSVDLGAALWRDRVPGELLAIVVADSVMRDFAMDSVDTVQEAEAVTPRLRAVAQRALDNMPGEVHGTAPGATIVRSSAPLRSVVIRTASDAAVQIMLERLRRDPRVESVMFNRYHAPPAWHAAVARRDSARALRRPGGARTADTLADPLRPHQAWHYELVELSRARQQLGGTVSGLVAVIDDGSRPDHPDVDSVYTNDGYNFVAQEAPDTMPACAATDNPAQHNRGGGRTDDARRLHDWSFDSGRRCWFPSLSAGHGLHVTATIAARYRNRTGGHGVAPGVRIRSIKVVGDKTTYGPTADDLAQGILYAAGLPATGRGGQLVQVDTSPIVLMSFAGTDYGQVVRDAVALAVKRGVLMVVPAGDSGSDMAVAFPGVLPVAALGPDGTVPSYSNRGESVPLSAPGGDFSWNETTGVMSATWNYADSRAAYDFRAGTAMAAAHVAGVAALVKSKNPGFSADSLRGRLLRYATPVLQLQCVRPPCVGLNAEASLRGSVPEAGKIQLSLVDRTQGRVLRTEPADAGGRFTLRTVPEGNYWLLARQDREGAVSAGDRGRRLGAHGGAATPVTISIGRFASVTADVTMGFHVEQEPNDDDAHAGRLYLDQGVVGVLRDTLDQDLYTVRLPDSGTYAFETGPVLGACDFGMELVPTLELLVRAETLRSDSLPTNDRVCAHITRQIPAGEYVVRVTRNRGAYGLRYRLWVRKVKTTGS